MAGPILTERRTLLAGLGAWLVFLSAVGLPRALERHLHVDEVQLAYEAALAMVHHRPDLAHGTSAVLIFAGALMASAKSTAAMFAVIRLVFFVLFALLLAACAWAQPYFTTTRGRLGVLFVATLCHPLWLYGFEIRMDLIIGLGSVILFGLTQRAGGATPLSWRGFFLAGFCSATMQLHSPKAIAYWIPFSTLLLARRRPAGYVAGFVAGAAANVVVIAIGGQTSLYLRGWNIFSGMAKTADRFSPTPELMRSILDAPILYCLAGTQIAITVIALIRRRRPTSTSLVTTGFLVWSLVLLYVNPTPFPYNFELLMPFALFAALDVAARLIAWQARRGGLIVIGLAAVSVVLFAIAWTTEPYLTRTNAAQLSYARAAEALARPDETVLDGAGLVLSRLPPHKDWFVHSLLMAAYRDHSLVRFADIMVQYPSPVLLDNYRWGWLSPADLQTRESRYVRIAPRLFVLGSALDGEGEVTIHLAGRYQLIGTANIDGVDDENGKVLTLTPGQHHYVSTGRAGLRWIGVDDQASIEAINAITSLGKGEPMFTNTPR